MTAELSGPFIESLTQLRHQHGLNDFELSAFADYEVVMPAWLDLNRRYKDGELSLDWQSHQLMWDNFYARRTGKLWILVASQGGTPQAIFPMVKEDDQAPWSLCDEFIIGREYFCPPDLIHRFSSLLSSIQQEDMHSFYIPQQPELFVTEPSGVVELKGDFDTYLASLDEKVQKALLRVWRINEDLRVEADAKVRSEAIADILASQLSYWLKKKGAVSETQYSYSRDKIHTDLKLMERAAGMGKLMALYFYEGGRLLAANFAVRRGLDGVDDYLCLRDCDAIHNRRSLGIYAIMKNQQHCREQGLFYYDLSACMAPYKRDFINTSMVHYHLYRPQATEIQTTVPV